MNKKAFTLVEISMALLVIAILMGGVFLGTSLRKQAGIDQLMSMVGKISNAVVTFEETYKQLPGDMYNPATFFVTNAINGNPATTAGNGDGTVSGNEGIYAFQHLAFAGLLEGNYNGTWIYNRMYKGSVANSGFYFTNAYTDPIVLRFARMNFADPDSTVISGSNLTYSVLSVLDMMKLDQKYDDGNPATGFIRSFDGSDAAANACINVSSAYNVSAGAQQNSEALVCYFDIRIKKNMFTTN
ncbi:MAG: prepilin-type N-terminal cleavage/methylation domain-containing protein [Alphaproteobacteria bacterium]|nr:prepilin-type N-terminal cleavage/methylation domain-containing protein [Alphaproteobacteria bacterium]OJV16322.1 MAG: hypothetical protein BGO27_03640 [Alphaproteobacteria bacterium 33-17]